MGGERGVEKKGMGVHFFKEKKGFFFFFFFFWANL